MKKIRMALYVRRCELCQSRVFTFFFFNKEGYQGIFEGWKNSTEREKLKTRRQVNIERKKLIKEDSYLK